MRPYPEEREFLDPVLLGCREIQDLANQKLRELAGKDATHVECELLGVLFHYDGPSAITYWRCIKETAVKKATQRRVAKGFRDRRAEVF